MKMIFRSKYLTPIWALSALLALSACGGGGGSGGGNAAASQTSTVSTGVMTKGSVIVNGVRFEDNSANIVHDDTPKQADALKDGMVVQVRGRINADGVTGIADNIEADNEVRGLVQAINTTATPAYIEILGQRVYVDDQTIYDGVAGISELANGNPVEVYGLRDANGDLRASRIELLNRAVDLPDEVRGIVSAKTATAFNLGALVVSYSGTTVIDPPNATFNNGDLVEVHLAAGASNTAGTATRIELEDLEDAVFAPGAGALLEIEGFVSDYVPGTPTFTVAGHSVQINSATRFLGGTELDLMNNIRVEAEGVLSGTTLIVSKLSFKRDRLRLQGVVSAVDVMARTLTVFGKTLSVTNLSQLYTSSADDASASFADIAIGERVEVRGFIDESGTIVVDQLEETNDNEDIVQARVSAKNEAAGTLELFGITAQVNPATIYEGANDAIIAMSAFFAAVTPASTTSPQNPGTLVKLEGMFNAGVLTVAEAEFEDD